MIIVVTALLGLIVILFALYVHSVRSMPEPHYKKFLQPGYSFVDELKEQGKYESLYPEKEWWLPQSERSAEAMEYNRKLHEEQDAEREAFMAERERIAVREAAADSSNSE